MNIFFLNDQPSRASQIVLLRRSPDEEDYPNALGGIGGSVEDSDEDVIEAGLRELREEVPSFSLVDENKIIWIGTSRINQGKDDEKLINYFVLCLPGLIDPSECGVGKLEWTPIEAAFENELVFPDIRRMIEVWWSLVKFWDDFYITMLIPEFRKKHKNLEFLKL